MGEGRLYGKGLPMDALKRLFRRGNGAVTPGTELATEGDVLACFRLLLGRTPNAEEWAGHSAQAGQGLAGVVAGYVNSLEFARRGLFRPVLDQVVEVAEMQGFRLYASPGDALIGRHVLAGGYEPEVEAVFRRVLRPGMGVVDIGANIGFFTMLSASVVGEAGFVLAVEPNPANARMLEASRRLNGFAQVVTAQVAAGRGTGLLVLNTTHSNGTTSTPEGDPAELLHAQTVASVAVDALVGAERRIGLIKVDVEGAEYNALLGAAGVLRRDRPLVISEFSPSLMPGISGVDGPGYLRWLYSMGYGVSVITGDGGLVEAGQEVGPVMEAYAARGVDHIDLLATPVHGERSTP